MSFSIADKNCSENSSVVKWGPPFTVYVMQKHSARPIRLYFPFTYYMQELNIYSQFFLKTLFFFRENLQPV